ncbi:winged helix-turn-helix domain-containing protein [Halovenus rubra]|uniref:Winged helix-turn-helix domain-containing protein n=2 Tax=Halovenus rubra TaxID=869890 RepID=A0ACC7DY56_9EURY|nr:helix-turn-helix domain-containing protein [Halovenus rubra]
MSGNSDTEPAENVENTKEETEKRIREIREKDRLTKLFTQSNGKIIAALLTSPHDMSATGLSEASGVNRTTVYEKKDVLLDLDVIEQTRTEGQSPMYDIADTDVAEAVADVYAKLY